MASLNIIKRTSERARMRVGRGGKRGKTAGRGTKGQNARAGRKKRPEWRDIIKKLPKRRGYGKNRARTVNADRPRPVAVSLVRLSALFPAGAEVTPKLLLERGVIHASSRKPAAKIIGNEIGKALIFKGCTASASAKAAIEKSGGRVE